MPLISGSTTFRAAATATAASKAFPPSSRISSPALVASGWAELTMPLVPTAGRVAVFLLAGPPAGSWPASAGEVVCPVVSPLTSLFSGAVVSSEEAASLPTVSWREAPSGAVDLALHEHTIPTTSATRSSRLKTRPRSEFQPPDAQTKLVLVSLADGILRLEPGEVPGAELRHLGRDHHLTVRLILVVPIVLLVVILGDVELLERRHLRHDGVAPEALRLYLGDHLCGDAPLLLVVIEDRRAVLRPDVRALPVQRRGVVGGEEDLQYLPERDDLRVERHLDDLRMTCGPGTHLAVRRVRHRAARVTGLDLLHAPQLVVDGLQAPEAAAR